MTRPWIALGLLALAGCERPATQIVLRVDSDLRPAEELRAVQVTTRRTGAAQDGVTRTVTLSARADALPGTLALVPSDPDDTRRLEVTVRAELAAGDGFSTRAVVNFQREQTLVLDVFLAARCRDPENRAGCGPDETCGVDGCEPIRRPVLPGYVADTPRLDAGPRDVIAADDASVDVPEDVTDDASTDVSAPVDAPANDVLAPVDVVRCGGPTQPCCDGSGCDPGLVCAAGTCQGCGARGDLCCAGGRCASGTSCQSGRCAPCGAEGQACCAGSACDAQATACARAGCNASGRCAMLPVADGTSCGAVRYGAWSACAYSSLCDRYGSQQRSVTSPLCRAGACADVTTTETRACSRATDGLACASTGYGPWSACGGYTSTCDNTGTQTRTVTAYRCASGSCASATSTGSQSCSRNTTNQTCSWTLNGRSCPGTCQSGACEPACGRAGCPC